MNPALSKLQPYPFERLRALLAGAQPPANRPHIPLYIGEPRHAPPAFALDALTRNLDGFGSYPLTAGIPQLRVAIANWLTRRFQLPSNSISPETMVLPAEVWERCQLLFLCSPSNPTGAVASIEYLRRALELAERYDFVVASDECYSEIYLDEGRPPPGLLQAALAAGNTSYERCIVFHSLSKRSSLPGMRSGFVAGDVKLMKQFLLYRTYHGSAMPQPTQMASIAAWDDETHVAQNRELYRQKFAAVVPILREVMDVEMPEAAFYLWPRVGDGERFTRSLFEHHNVTVLPGSYIARNMPGGNPGHDRVRISLVATVPECIAAAHRIREFVAVNP